MGAKAVSGSAIFACRKGASHGAPHPEIPVDAQERRRTVAAAKAYVGRAARRVAEEAIQLHGGMGVTNELAASHYAKRLVMLDFMQGDADHHLARFAASALV